MKSICNLKYILEYRKIYLVSHDLWKSNWLKSGHKFNEIQMFYVLFNIPWTAKIEEWSRSPNVFISKMFYD